jgi:DNA-binding transcriptional LysR family regulator
MPPRTVAYKDTTLQQLRTFLVVVEKESFTAAADLVRLSTTTVWEQVRALEAQYDVPLVRRRGRRVVPTPEGQRLAEMLTDVLAALDSTKGVLKQESGRPPEQLTIVCAVRMFLDELCGAIATFHARYPEIRLNLLQSGTDDIAPLVARGEVDLAVTSEPSARDSVDGKVDFEFAYDSEFLLVLPPKHPLARKRRLELVDILRYPLIIGHRQTHIRQRVDEVLHKMGLLDEMRVAVETGTGAFTIQCVRAGMGIGISGGNPRGMLTEGLAVRSLRPWFGDFRTVFIWRRGAHRPPIVQELAQCIRERMSANRRR